MANITDNHGVVSKCPACTNPKLPMHCKSCFSRGFTAICLACSGTGQLTVPVAGAPSGEMKSTCAQCGGTGHFGVNKPADWDAEHPPKKIPAETDEVVDEEVEEFNAITAGAADAPEVKTSAGPVDPMMEAIREMQAKPPLPELKRPTTIHHMKWKKMTREKQLEAIEEANKIELVTA